MTDADELRRLNRATFAAEQDRDRQRLEAILADEFRIKRASGVVQTKGKEMIYEVLFGINPFTSRDVSEDGAPGNPTIFDDCGVVTSLLTTHETTANAESLQKAFRNVKVFARQEGRWRCVSWQVFRES